MYPKSGGLSVVGEAINGGRVIYIYCNGLFWWGVVLNLLDFVFIYFINCPYEK